MADRKARARVLRWEDPSDSRTRGGGWAVAMGGGRGGRGRPGAVSKVQTGQDPKGHRKTMENYLARSH